MSYEAIQGWNAFVREESLFANPYPRGTLENRNWDFGWHSACQDDVAAYYRRRNSNNWKGPSF